MKRHLLAASLSTAAAAALTLGAGACASAAAAPAADAPLSSMTLTIVPDGPVTGPLPDRVTLECDPAGGTHPEAKSACAELTAVGGDFYKLPDAPVTVCSHVIDPVTAVAEGTWKDTKVDYSEHFQNRCLAAAYTAQVFDF